jgi:hypothetical protein
LVAQAAGDIAKLTTLLADYDEAVALHARDLAPASRADQ